MRAGILAGAVVLMAIGGCAGRPQVLQPGAETVKVGKADAVAGSVYIGEVSGQDGHGCGMWGRKGTYAGAVMSVRNQAYAMGADYVQIMGRDTPNLEFRCYDNTYRIDATAYRTPAAPARQHHSETVYRLGEQRAAYVPPPTSAAPAPLTASAQSAPSPTSVAPSREQQLHELMQQNLPYEEYQRRYREIMEQ